MIFINRSGFAMRRQAGFPLGAAAAVLTFFAIISGAVQAASTLTQEFLPIEDANLSTLWSDDFNDGSINPSLWRLGVLTRSALELNPSVVVAEQSGNLAIAPISNLAARGYRGYVSVSGSDLTNGTAAIKIVGVASSGADTIFSLGIDNNNFIRFRAKGSTLYLENETNGITTRDQLAFSTALHQYWRFRHDPSANTILFETRAYNTNWTVRKSVSPPFSIVNLFVELSSGTSTALAVPGIALFDNFSFTNGTATTPLPTATPIITPTQSATLTPSPSATSTFTPTPPPIGGSRGYLTTPAELRIIKQKADQFIQPYKASYDSLMSYVGSPSNWPVMDFTGVDVCNFRDPMQDGAARVYALTLAYNLTGNTSYAAAARIHILEMARSQAVNYTYSGSNGCALTLSRHAPGYIVAADLLAGYSGWTAADKAVFLDWLNNHVYHLVDWASEERSTNWGGDGSNVAGLIADYFANSGRTLRDRNGVQSTPHTAYLEAKDLQLHRMNGANDQSTGAPFPRMKNSVCKNFQATSSTDGYAHGIQPHGGIPEETGRGSTGCAGSRLLSDDSAWTYMHTTLTGMMMQAEMHLRRGDPSLYDNINSSGRGSLRKAMEFTVTPFGAYSSRTSLFELGYRYYRDPVIGASIGVGGTRKIAGSGNTVFLHFGTLTHGFALNENPGPPPTVPAP
jgi:hypothetical protein